PVRAPARGAVLARDQALRIGQTRGGIGLTHLLQAVLGELLEELEAGAIGKRHDVTRTVRRLAGWERSVLESPEVCLTSSAAAATGSPSLPSRWRRRTARGGRPARRRAHPTKPRRPRGTRRADPPPIPACRATPRPRRRSAPSRA